MSRIVIYGIGSVLSKIKSNIVWSNIAAVIVCKDMVDDCEDIIGFREALIKAHPEDVNVFDYVMGLHYFYPCNMFATTWSVFDEYCQWLFSFIIPAACNIDVSVYNAYSKRVIGFFAERMMTVWVIKKKFKVEELPYITVE